MRNLANTLTTAWLVLALIIVPLRAVAAPLAADSGKHDCAMMQHGEPASAAMQQHMDHATGDHGQPACAKCKGQGCDHGQCKSGSCCTLSLQFTVNSLPPADPVGPHSTRHLDATQRPAAPPPALHYRPPV